MSLVYIVTVKWGFKVGLVHVGGVAAKPSADRLQIVVALGKDSLDRFDALLGSDLSHSQHRCQRLCLDAILMSGFDVEE